MAIQRLTIIRRLFVLGGQISRRDRLAAYRALRALDRIRHRLDGLSLGPLDNRLMAIWEDNLPDLSDDDGLDPPDEGT